MSGTGQGKNRKSDSATREGSMPSPKITSDSRPRKSIRKDVVNRTQSKLDSIRSAVAVKSQMPAGGQHKSLPSFFETEVLTAVAAKNPDYHFPEKPVDPVLVKSVVILEETQKPEQISGKKLQNNGSGIEKPFLKKSKISRKFEITNFLV